MEEPSILAQASLGENEFAQLFIRPDGLNHLLLSDSERVMQDLQQQFPEVVKIESIGTSWQNRPINMMVVDARDYISGGKVPTELKAEVIEEIMEKVQGKNATTNEKKEEKVVEKSVKLEKAEKAEKAP